MPILFEVNGWQRGFEYYEPNDWYRAVLQIRRPLPLVIGLHGARRGGGAFRLAPGNMMSFSHDSGLRETQISSLPKSVVSAGILTIIPPEEYAFFAHVEGRSFDEDQPNQARGEWGWSKSEDRDDVDYVDAVGGVIDRIAALSRERWLSWGLPMLSLVDESGKRLVQDDFIDRARIHLVGLGTGGTMALRLAMEMTRYRPRGVVVVGGSTGGYEHGSEKELDHSLATAWAPTWDWASPPASYSDGTFIDGVFPDRILFLHAQADPYVMSQITPLGENVPSGVMPDWEPRPQADAQAAADLEAEFANLDLVPPYTVAAYAAPQWYGLLDSMKPWLQWGQESPVPIDPKAADLVIALDVGNAGLEVELPVFRWSAVATYAQAAVVALIAVNDPDEVAIPALDAHAFPGSPLATGEAPAVAWGCNGFRIVWSFLKDPTPFLPSDGIAPLFPSVRVLPW